MNNSQSLDKDKTGSVILTGYKLTKTFGGLMALNAVDVQLYEQEILGLIGPNGAGKTTLFNVIAGVYKPDSGRIDFREEKISGLRPDLICKRGIARTFQITKPFLEMSALENVMVGSYFGVRRKRTLKSSKRAADKILGFLRLEDKRKVLASQLTLVERKRLEIARALSTEPNILLLDEVIGGLNPTETIEMMALIKRIRSRGISILMIEHVMKAIMGISDRVIVLHYGQKLTEGNPKEIVKNKDVIEAYLGGMAHAHAE